MKTREVTVASGETFVVPQGVQRLDSKTTKGWQVRYQGTKYFADGQAGASSALASATKELLRRIATLPAPVVLKKAPSPRKSSTLPPGISGPILVTRRRSEPEAVISVLIPRYGSRNTIRKIRIGTRSSYTQARYEAAVSKAIAMRTDCLAKYVAAAAKAKRSEAKAFKKASTTA